MRVNPIFWDVWERLSGSDFTASIASAVAVFLSINTQFVSVDRERSDRPCVSPEEMYFPHPDTVGELGKLATETRLWGNIWAYVK